MTEDTSRVDCLCMGLGPQLTALLRGVVSPETLAEQWKSGELETLKLLRLLIDQRISSLAGPEPSSRGTTLTVE